MNLIYILTLKYTPIISGGISSRNVYSFKKMKPEVDPFSPDNLIVFSVSPLTGLPVSGQSRMTVTTKSPLTGETGDSQAGGFMPAYMKANGYDAIIIREKSEKPVYIYIDNDDVKICSAENVWGKITGEAEEIIKQELGELKIEIAQIGPGGENIVKYASIMNRNKQSKWKKWHGCGYGFKKSKSISYKKLKNTKTV